MLVCNVSLRPARTAIAVDLAEIATAIDASSVGLIFATIVDDPASAGEFLDAYSGEIMLEAASADAVVSVPAIYSDTVNETMTASSTQDATLGAADPSFANVKLLLGFEGANGSTGAPGMTDESSAAHGTATVGGNAHIDTAQFKFGTSSLLSDGNGDYITFPSSTDWALSSANSDQFTVECFVRSTTTTPTSKYIIWKSVGLPDVNWWLGVNASTQLEFVATTDGSTFWSVNPGSSGITWATNTWYHLAADKDSSGKVRVYRDGVMVASGTPTSSVIKNSAIVLSIGSDQSVPSRSWPGWIDEVRITKGVARYASDSGFTAPTVAFPRS